LIIFGSKGPVSAKGSKWIKEIIPIERVRVKQEEKKKEIRLPFEVINPENYIRLETKMIGTVQISEWISKKNKKLFLADSNGIVCARDFNKIDDWFDAGGGKIQINGSKDNDKWAIEIVDLKGNVAVSEKEKFDMEKLQQKMDAFMQETFTIWYGEEAAKKVKLSMSTTPLGQIDYEKMSKDVDPAKFGEYTMNPDRASTGYIEKNEIPKIAKDLNKINEELQQKFAGRPRSEVMKYVVDTYGDKYRLPDLEDEEYILSLSEDKIPEQLKDGNWYYFMGSTFRRQGGKVSVPIVDWDGGELDQRARVGLRAIGTPTIVSSSSRLKI